MIILSNEFGYKNIFVNILKNNISTSISTEQLYPNTQRTRYSVTKYKLFVTNILTKAETSVHLIRKFESKRGYYFSFEMGRDGLEITDPGTYEYRIMAMSGDAGLIDSGLNDKIFELDKGLLHIYNKDTFTDTYIKPNAVSIPVTKVYNPE